MKNLLLLTLLSISSLTYAAPFKDKSNAACNIKLGPNTYNGDCIIRYNNYEKSWMVFEPNDQELFTDVHYLNMKVTGIATREVTTMAWDDVIDYGEVRKVNDNCYASSKLRICYKMK